MRTEFSYFVICAAVIALAGCDDSGGTASAQSSSESSSTAASSSTGSSSSKPPGGFITTNGNTHVALSSGAYTVPSTATTAVVTVVRSGSSIGQASVNFQTVNGTAVSNVDYTPSNGVLTWADGDTSSKTVTVPVTTAGGGKQFSVALTPVTGSAASVSAPSTATVAIASAASNSDIPAAAAAVGYSTQTFGPAITMGNTWYDYDFYRPATAASSTENSDGSVLVTGIGQGISSAHRDKSKHNDWGGTAFGGGGYFEATLSFTGADDSKVPSWPAWWACDVENMSQNAVTALTQWLGQPTGFGNWIETDFFEYDRENTGQYGVQIHDWYGFHDHGSVQQVRAFGNGVKVPANFDWSQPHKYGFLWVPATASAQGYAKMYLDDVQVGPTIYWNQYDPTAPPPPLVGSTAFSVLDARHLVLILDTGTHNPMTVYSVSVWQSSGSNNIIQ